MAENRGILGDTWAFTKAAGSGAWDAGADIVEGVGELAKSGYELATDPKARESAWKTTKQLAEKASDYGEAVINDPAKPYRDARDGTIAAYDRFNKSKELATKEGLLSEFYGEMTGGGAVEVGSILIPAGAVAKAGKLGKVVNVVDDLGASKKAKGVLGGSAVKQLDDHVSPIQKCPVKGVINNVDDAEHITVYRGDRPETNVIKSKASSEYGYKGAQDVIDNSDLDDLFKQHKESSDIPPSPFISTTSDKKVAEFFAGENGVVNEFRIHRDRASMNKYNDFMVPAGTKGELIPENEYLVPLYIKPSEFVKKRNK